MLTVEETIAKNPLWEQSSDEVTECEMNKQQHTTKSEKLDEFKSELSNQLSEEIDDEGLLVDKLDETPSVERIKKLYPPMESMLDDYSSDSNQPLPKINMTTTKQVDKPIPTPHSHAEEIQNAELHDSRNESFHSHFHENNHGRLPPVELLLKSRFRETQKAHPPLVSQHTMTSQICEPSTVAQPEFGSSASDLDCLANTAISMCHQQDDYSHSR